MKRDLQLIKKILQKIEEDFVNVALFNIEIDSYDRITVCNHCKMLYQDGLLLDFSESIYENGKQVMFGVGNLTSNGYDYLESIREKDEFDYYKKQNIIINNPIIMNAKTINNEGVVGQNGNQQKEDM